MEITEMFGLALGLSKPWFIKKVEFVELESSHKKELHLYLDYSKGHAFQIGDQVFNRIYDHHEKMWRHANFFEHECFLHAQVPRVINGEGKPVLVNVPWARPGSQFTLLFEAFSFGLVESGLSYSAAGGQVKEDGRVIFRIVKAYVDKARSEQQLEQVKLASLDETSFKKGHNYFTILTDVERKKVVGIGKGKDENAVQQAINEMEGRGSKADEVEQVGIDLSPAFISACMDKFENAQIVFDRFHVEQMLSKAVDSVRQLEADANKELRKSKYLWLRNASSLKPKQEERVHYLISVFPVLGQAYRLKEAYKEIFNNLKKEDAVEALEEWIKMVNESKIYPLIKFANSLKAHWSGVIQYFEKRSSNGFAERVNLKIQEIKRTAKGFRNQDNFITTIYLHLGKLNFQFHTI
jgi:transposase